MKSIKFLLFGLVFTCFIDKSLALTYLTNLAGKVENAYTNFEIINHPLVEQKLTVMRDKNTSSMVFRQMLDEISMLMGYEITRHIRTKEFKIETPIARTVGKKLAQEVVIVPILRAGLGMVAGLHRLIPSADIAHIGLYRDPLTKKPVEYLFKHPKITSNQLFIVVDPMLATGNSAVYAVQKLKDTGVASDQIILMVLVAVSEGVATFSSAHPEVKIYAAALDKKLNKHAYIVPGLGDAGDRLFGTK